jgi:hypothetical protein
MSRRTLLVAGVLCLTAAAAPRAQIVSGRGAPPSAPAPAYTQMLEPPTKIEALLARTGTIVIRNFYRVGNRFTMGATIDAVVVSEPGREDRRLRGLRVSVREAAGGTERSSTSFVDMEELSGLSQAVTDLASIAAKWNGREEEHFIDAQFTTVGGLAIGFAQDRRVQRAFLQAGFIEPTRTTIDIQDLLRVRDMIDEAITLLRTK